MNTKEPLKSCPFCGKPPALVTDFLRDHVTIQCVNTTCKVNPRVTTETYAYVVDTSSTERYVQKAVDKITDIWNDRR